MREITVKDLVEAIRKDGYEQAFGHYIVYKNKDGYASSYPSFGYEITAACALGQAGLNLNVEPMKLQRGFGKLARHRADDFPYIARLNDQDKLPLDKIADSVEEWAIKNNELDTVILTIEGEEK